MADNNNNKDKLLEDHNRRRALTYYNSIDDYSKRLETNDPQKLGKVSVPGLRDLVSKQKKRFKDSRFDLDLAYITDRIVAMGFPAEGMHGMYRNPMKQVQGFLEYYHKDHYKVYNLCCEREYDPIKFQNRVAKYPFEDHNCPSLELMFAFCKDLNEWLDKNEDNVGIVHCKAGKGRTGLMICAFLAYRYGNKGVDSQKALDFYAVRRTHNHKGVTIRSQVRFVHYFWQVLDLKIPEKVLKQTRELKTIRLTTLPKLDSNKAAIWMQVEDNTRPVFSTKMEEKPSKLSNEDLEFAAKIHLSGSVKVSFHDGEKELGYFWFHMGFIVGDKIEFGLNDFDGKAKKQPKNILQTLLLF